MVSSCIYLRENYGLTEKSNGTQHKESQGRSEVLTAVDNDNIVVGVLADGGLDPGNNLEGAVAQARGVGNLAVVNDVAGLIAALLVDGGALDAALLGGTLLASVGLGAGLRSGGAADDLAAVVLAVATLLDTSRVAVLADSRLNPGDNVEGVVSEAGSILNLAVINDISSSVAASLVGGGAGHTALLRSSRRLLSRGANDDLAVLVVAALLGRRVRLITVLADIRLLPGNNVPGVIAQTDGVLGLAVLDDGTVGGTARVIDSGALDAALLRGSGGLGGLGLVVLAHGRLDPGDDVEGVVTQASGVLDLAVIDDITSSVTAGLVGGGASDTADLGGLGLLGDGDGGHALGASSGLNKASAGVGVVAQALSVVRSARSVVSTGSTVASIVLRVAVRQAGVGGQRQWGDRAGRNNAGRNNRGRWNDGLRGGNRVDGLDGLGGLGQSTRAEGHGHKTGEGERVSHLDVVVVFCVCAFRQGVTKWDKTRKKNKVEPKRVADAIGL